MKQLHHVGRLIGGIEEDVYIPVVVREKRVCSSCSTILRYSNQEKQCSVCLAKIQRLRGEKTDRELW